MVKKQEENNWRFIHKVRSVFYTLRKEANQLRHFYFQNTFYRKYRHTSLAILSYFESKSDAIATASMYQVPLMRISITSQEQEELIWKYLINCFQNSQIVNYSFILWVHFENQCPQAKIKQICSGFIECYNKHHVYHSMKVMELPQNEEEVQQILCQLRSQYYSIQEEENYTQKEEDTPGISVQNDENQEVQNGQIQKNSEMVLQKLQQSFKRYQGLKKIEEQKDEEVRQQGNFNEKQTKERKFQIETKMFEIKPQITF